MSKWGKLEREIWKKSEVMNEFEKNMVNALVDITRKVEAQQNLVQKIDTINKGVDTASTKMDSFLNKAKNLAEDDLDEDEETLKEPTPEEQTAAREQLLLELTELASKAADERNYKLAYKIERLAMSISEE